MATRINVNTEITGTLKLTDGNATIAGDVTGNARGSGSLDIQSSRTAVTQVASGADSVALGINNTASIDRNNVAIGEGNTSSGSYYGTGESSAIGASNTASGWRSSAIGYINTASGDGSFALGVNQSSYADNNIRVGGDSAFFNINSVGFSTNNMNALAGFHATSDLLVTDITSLGAEKVTNGTFTGSATGWTLGTGWAYLNNRITKNADGTGTLSQDVSAVAGEYYLLTFDIQGFSAGTLDISLGGQSVEQMNADSASTKEYKAVIKATTTGDLIFTSSNTSFISGIDNVSVKKITGGNLDLPEGYTKQKVYTVATLPTVGTAGRRAFVSDANATTFASIVAAGGANVIPVYDDGTNWRIG